MCRYRIKVSQTNAGKVREEREVIIEATNRAHALVVLMRRSYMQDFEFNKIRIKRLGKKP